MNEVTLKVVEVKETKTGNYWTKFEEVTNATKEVGGLKFGMMARKFYAYLGGKSKVGSKVIIDLDMMDIVKKNYYPNGEEDVDEETGEVNVRYLNYLYPKK